MELLAPAGDLKILKTAIAAGADAVYFGGDNFGARVSAAFSEADGLAAIDYAHTRGKKVYLTVNTLLKNVEMERSLYDFLAMYNKNHVDGIIVQDFGVLSFCRKFFPNLPLHASTQLNIASKYGAEFIQKNGACRIVPARELSLKEISAIHEALPDLEIEVFLHGALCVCYSGQCLMSSFIGGRSGNRGACAQPCRKKYTPTDEKGNRIGEAGYYLSPKDLCGLYALPKLYEAGVDSCKIEGRLKNEAYVAGVVSVYREYFDRLFSEGTKDYRVDEADHERLLSYGNRGGSTDKYFYLRNDTSMVDPKVGSFVQSRHEVSFSDKKRKVGAILSVYVGEPLSMNVTYGSVTVSVEGEVVEAAKKAGTTEAEIKEKITKTGEEAFDFSDLRVEMDEGAFVPMKHIKDIRRRAFSVMEDMLKKEYSIRLQNSYTPVEDFPMGKRSRKPLYVSVENEAQLMAVHKSNLPEIIYIPPHMAGSIKRQEGYAYYLKLPVVIRDGDDKRLIDMIPDFDGVAADSYDALGLLEKIDYPKERIHFMERLYSYSDRTVRAFMDAGYEDQFVPLELSQKELLHRYNNMSSMLIYGQTVVMVMANCPAKRFYGCGSEASKSMGKRPYTRIDLIDEKNAAFPVVNNCGFCTNYVYNSLPMSLLNDADEVKKLDVGAYLMEFVFEEPGELEEILSLYESNYLNGGKKDLKKNTTRLHFKRGV